MEAGFEGRPMALPSTLLFNIFTMHWERSLKNEGRHEAGFRFALGIHTLGIQEAGRLQVGQ